MAPDASMLRLTEPAVAYLAWLVARDLATPWEATRRLTAVDAQQLKHALLHVLPPDVRARIARTARAA